MFYYYTDTPFQNRIIRLIRADDGQPGISDELAAVARQANKSDSIIAVIMDGNNIFHFFRTDEERKVWEAFVQQHPLVHDEYYQWTRAQAEA